MPAAMLQSTFLFCRSDPGGTILPTWNDACEADLRGEFEVGLTIGGRYQLQEQLGQGSMGRVFRAQDLRLDRPVALKVISFEGAKAGVLESVLEREAKLGAGLHHHGIAAVHDFGYQQNKSYTVFEFIEGELLRQLLARRGKLPLAETLPALLDLAEALDYAHAKGVIHRDLKPENICYTKRGEFKILDLGIARNIQRDVEQGVYSGTPAYSSPEQAKCRSTDGRSDQYSLALIVFEMLAGRRAFDAPRAAALLREHIDAPPPKLRTLAPHVPEHVERAVDRALSKKREQRFATCVEFARELGGGALPAWQRHVVSTPSQERIAFYLAHVAEESRLAKQIAEELEQAQYVCWFYGRDAVPGIPFSRQAPPMIERSQGVILLVSRAALRSAEFAREIEHARHVGCPLLPLLVDLTREELEKLSPAMVGSGAIVEHRRGSSVSELAGRLAGAAEALGIARDERLARSAPASPVRCSGQIWATDANQIDIVDLDRVLFRNSTIDDFLQGKHRHFISATKGFGKTLLLTCKRRQLTQASSSQGQPLLLIPEGRPYLDFMSEMRTLSERFETPLSDLINTKRVWSASLRISAISHHPGVISASEASELAAFPARLQRWLSGGKIQPTVVFKELTSLRVGELNRLIDDTENFLDQKLRMIHGATCFFIDKVDQAIHHLSRDAWIAIQAGLIEAAWELMNANSHVKIYASIRQEAFINYQSDIKSNLFAATTNLHYSDEELQSLLDQLAGCYEGCASFADFLGMNVVRHGRRPAPEDSFQYVRRHTSGRPRDLVAIASQISAKRNALSEKLLREIVQQTSSAVLVSNVFDEARVFLNCLGDRNERLRFLALLPGNILQKHEAVRACELFNGLEAGTLQHFGEDSAEIYHPFRDLYLTGLLGVVERDPELGISLQRFRRAHDALAYGAFDLPESPVYLLHPALDTFIRAQRTRVSFLQYQHIAVGDELIWEPHYSHLMQVEQQLHVNANARFVELAHQVVKRVQSLLMGGPTPFARLDLERSDEWQSLRREAQDDASAEALLWLEELLGQL
jgi:hypothetical protein